MKCEDCVKWKCQFPGVGGDAEASYILYDKSKDKKKGNLGTKPCQDLTNK